jgi:hypothetical protein
MPAIDVPMRSTLSTALYLWKKAGATAQGAAAM